MLNTSNSSENPFLDLLLASLSSSSILALKLLTLIREEYKGCSNIKKNLKKKKSIISILNPYLS